MADDLARFRAAPRRNQRDRVGIAAHVVSARPAAWSAAAVLLAMLVWVALGSGVQSLRGATVLTFLGAAPVLLVARVAPRLGPAGVATIGAACSVAVAALTAFAMFIAGVWAPGTAVLVLSAVVWLGATLDVVNAWRRQVDNDM
jgi:hypothetical protein